MFKIRLKRDDRESSTFGTNTRSNDKRYDAKNRYSNIFAKPSEFSLKVTGILVILVITGILVSISIGVGTHISRDSQEDIDRFPGQTLSWVRYSVAVYACLMLGIGLMNTLQGRWTARHYWMVEDMQNYVTNSGALFVTREIGYYQLVISTFAWCVVSTGNILMVSLACYCVVFWAVGWVVQNAVNGYSKKLLHPTIDSIGNVVIALYFLTAGTVGIYYYAS